MCPKDGVANSVDPDQTAPEGTVSSLIWVYSVFLDLSVQIFGMTTVRVLVVVLQVFTIMSLVTRKPVFGVFNQVRLKLVCSAKEAS